MSVIKPPFAHLRALLLRSSRYRSPAYLLPAISVLIIVLLTATTLLLPSSAHSLPEFRSNRPTAGLFMPNLPGMPHEDEFGLKSPTDPVRIEQGDKDTGKRIVVHTVRQGESLTGILTGAGLSRLESFKLERELEKSFPANGFAPGITCEIETNVNGTFSGISWRMERVSVLHLDKEEQNGELSVWQENLPCETKLATLAGTISTTIAEELTRNNRASLTKKVSTLLSSRVDLDGAALRGATYRILYEERRIGRELVDTGNILAVEISTARRHYNAYRFTDARGGSSYYDEQGLAVMNRPLYLQPCDFDHVSSEFGYRRHPISRVIRFHGGVDLAATVGTPVRAVADGIVVFHGRNGGAGNMITISHGGGMHTQYLHLSRFAPRSTFGSSVQQGDVIGYVGSTGSSTGPHLDFRVIMNGILQEPLATLATPAPKRALSAAELCALLAKIDLYQVQVNSSLFRVASISERPTVSL